MKNKNEIFEKQLNNSMGRFLGGIFICGIFFVGLALMFFIFPSLTGILFASILLISGIAVLVFGYQTKRLFRLTKPLRTTPNYEEACVGNSYFDNSQIYYEIQSY